MTDDELKRLLVDIESDRVERKESDSASTKIREAVCAFANDMPNNAEAGVIFIGVKDDGSCANLPITDELLRKLSDIRSDGNILPLPIMTVQKRVLQGCETAVILVEPSDFPPVRYRGRVWIRVGPRRAIASAEEERRLNERRRSNDLPFDLKPVSSSSMYDLQLDLFEQQYLRVAVAPDILAENERTISQQLTSLRFVTVDNPNVPTVVGLLAVGKSPADFIPGAYIQFLRIDGTDLAAPIMDQKECHGPLPDVLRRIDEILDANIHVAIDIQSDSTERQYPDYPVVAMQQYLRNAVMHRDYESSNAPIRLTWFKDRIEIQNPGGPYGQVTRDNFGQPGITD